MKPAIRAASVDDLRWLAGYVVRVAHERPAGLFCSARRWWEIDQIAVGGADRGSGVARALVQHVVAQAHAQGIVEIELTCWAFNQDAQAAFKKLGFVPKHVRFELPKR
jgi:ribosomal protein S18 acetylase RimI-like enzyme